ncbi:cell adhesion molecule 3 [Mytilus galloprovincialis]|uniref:Cell adhesion molecule 3 n=1 Tax=Mytilus galloprovincialis TaxID=29158 RepID=A0A8B6FYD9_MYTGA|nr:cell adhesion molecule 3 [Mytilus galloprovincialis]
MAVSLFGKFMIFGIICKGVNALQVSMNSDITAAIGDTDVELTCQFTTENDDFVNLIYLTARNKTTDSFYRIVTFYPPHRNKEASLSTGGEYLSGRVSLTNPTSDTSAAIMSYKNPVQCEDDTDYRCDIHYDNNGELETMQSDPTTITITSPSSKPDSVTMYPFTGISHEDYVSFICEGNVGNPAGKFVWRKHLAGEHNPVVYSDPVTVSTKIQDSCSYHGTSNLTIQLTEDDNGAKISCVEQSYQLETMMRKTSPLNIHYKVRNVVISKDPDVETHIRDPMNQINLTCVADGNPAPFYNWYKEPDLETVLSLGDTFIIKEMLTNKSGIYRCKAYHYIKGAMYSEEQMVNVTIVEDPNKMPSRGDPNTKSGSTVIIVVILSLLVVIAVVVLSYSYYRIKNKESSDLKEVLSKLKCQQVFSRIKCPQSFPRIKCPQSFPRVTCPQFLRRRGSDSKVGSGESWAESDRSSIHTDHNIDLSPDYSTVIDENETIDTRPKAHPRKNHYDDVVLQLDEKSSQQRNGTVPTSGDHLDDDTVKSADDSKLYTNAKLVDQNKLTNLFTIDIDQPDTRTTTSKTFGKGTKQAEQYGDDDKLPDPPFISDTEDNLMDSDETLTEERALRNDALHSEDNSQNVERKNIQSSYTNLYDKTENQNETGTQTETILSSPKKFPSIKPPNMDGYLITDKQKEKEFSSV